MFQDPEQAPHTSKMLPGADQPPLVINASDMDEKARMKGFGGEPAKRMIMQALGKNPDERPKYRDLTKQKREKTEEAPAAKAPKSRISAAPVASAPQAPQRPQ